MFQKTMLDTLFERRVSQNTALGAFAVWQSAVSFTDETKSDRGLPLTHSFLVLPLVFHRASAEVISTKQMTEGSFFRAITEARTISVGLQARVSAMYSQTCSAVNLGLASALLRMDKEGDYQLYPSRKSLPGEQPRSTLGEDVSTILKASRRLGYWFAVTDFATLCNLLRVRF